MNDGAVQGLPELLAGTLLGQRYRIVARLGHGTMGVVYAVERITDGHHFAAKLLGGNPNHQAMARFAREARLLGQLQHPHLITLIEAEVTPDRMAYIIMELVSGKSLADYPGYYGDCGFLIPILSQIAAALCAVHAAGVVHRDLKPGNVLLCVDPGGVPSHAKLVDFGVARLFDRSPSAAKILTPAAQPEPLRPARGVTETLPLAPAQTRRLRRSSAELTSAGMLLGTLLYMAPELRGGAHLAQPPADIFSFGVMAYEVLTKTMPFDEIPLFGMHDTALRFAPLQSLCPGLSPALVQALEACLAAEPTQRPTAAELVAIFQRDSGYGRL